MGLQQNKRILITVTANSHNIHTAMIDKGLERE